MKSSRLSLVSDLSWCNKQEVLVKGLAESRTFQRFALRTHTNLEEAKKVGTEYFQKGLEELEKTSATGGSGPPKPPLRGLPGFFAAFAKEVRKDFTGR